MILNRKVNLLSKTLLASKSRVFYILWCPEQVQIGNHSFTFDHVYGNKASPSSSIFDECVSPLLEGLFQGYNATVLAYGQVKLSYTWNLFSRLTEKLHLYGRTVYPFASIELHMYEQKLYPHVLFCRLVPERLIQWELGILLEEAQREWSLKWWQWSIRKWPHWNRRQSFKFVFPS